MVARMGGEQGLGHSRGYFVRTGTPKYLTPLTSTRWHRIFATLQFGLRATSVRVPVRLAMANGRKALLSGRAFADLFGFGYFHTLPHKDFLAISILPF